MRASLLIASVALVGASVSIAAQAPAQKAAIGRTAKAFTPPRTPWGDPDISGNVTKCHEGNYGLVNMLEIARAADKKAAGAR